MVLILGSYGRFSQGFNMGKLATFFLSRCYCLTVLTKFLSFKVNFVIFSFTLSNPLHLPPNSRFHCSRYHLSQSKDLLLIQPLLPFSRLVASSDSWFELIWVLPQSLYLCLQISIVFLQARNIFQPNKIHDVWPSVMKHPCRDWKLAFSLILNPHNLER